MIVAKLTILLQRIAMNERKSQNLIELKFDWKSKTMLLKTGFTLLVIAFTSSMKITAQDVINFTWYAEGTKNVMIQATDGKEFSINWGDATVETKIGEGDVDMVLSHIYANPNEYSVTIVASGSDCRFTTFDCYDHDNWYEECENNMISSLTFSDCSALTYLDCSLNQLTSLNLASCTNLTTLSCHSNQLINLDLSECTAITLVGCYNNQLTNLDLTNFSTLSRLYCFNNELTNLYLTGCSGLQTLECQNNQLTSLNLSGCSSLSILLCFYNQLTNLDLTGCMALSILSCPHNQLTDLDLTDCSVLNSISFVDNQFLPSYLYSANLLIDNPNSKYLGTQNLKPQTIAQGGVIDYSNEVEFGGINTNFAVEKNWTPAILDIDYSINNGIFTFHNLGVFTLTMTNEAIVSHPNYPAIVIATINVGTVGLHEISTSNIKVYPNPTRDMLFIECEDFSTIKLYDILGKEILIKNISKKTTEINISHLPKGMYSIRIISEGKIIGNSKIIKQ